MIGQKITVLFFWPVTILTKWPTIVYQKLVPKVLVFWLKFYFFHSRAVVQIVFLVILSVICIIFFYKRKINFCWKSLSRIFSSVSADCHHVTCSSIHRHLCLAHWFFSSYHSRWMSVKSTISRNKLRKKDARNVIAQEEEIWLNAMRHTVCAADVFMDHNVRTYIKAVSLALLGYLWRDGTPGGCWTFY